MAWESWVLRDLSTLESARRQETQSGAIQLSLSICTGMNDQVFWEEITAVVVRHILCMVRGREASTWTNGVFDGQEYGRNRGRVWHS